MTIDQRMRGEIGVMIEETIEETTGEKIEGMIEETKGGETIDEMTPGEMIEGIEGTTERITKETERKGKLASPKVTTLPLYFILFSPPFHSILFGC